jgi:thiol-disulfide isomerase/thioredoxin
MPTQARRWRMGCSRGGFLLFQKDSDMFDRLRAVGAVALLALALVAAMATTRGGPTVGSLKSGSAAPDFTKIDNWLNSDPLTMQQLRGKVVLVDFWTYSCINCIDTLPYVESWYQTYKDRGLTVIGVHTPEYPFERDTINVRAAIKHLGIRFPVAQDNQYATWNAYSNQYWPAAYLIDKKGRVVYSHFGEGDYAQTETVIKNLLAQKE